MTRSVSRAFAIIVASDTVSRGAIFLFGVVAARFSGPEVFGAYSFVVLLATYLWSIADLGATNLGIKMAAQARDSVEARGVAESVIGTRATLAILVFALACLVVMLIPMDYAIKAATLSVGPILLGNALMLAWYARARQEYASYVLTYAGVAAAFLVASFVIMMLPSLAENAAMLVLVRSTAWLVGVLVVSPPILVRLGLTPFRPRVRVNTQLIAKSWWLGIAGLISGVYALVAMWTLQHRVGASSLGIFGAAWQIQQVLLAAAATLHMVFFPRIYATAKGGRAAAHVGIQQMSNMASLGAVACTGVFVLLGAEILRWLFGLNYVQASGSMGWASAGVGMVLFRYVGEVTLMVLDRRRTLLLAAGAGLCVSIALANWFISGPSSAAVAYFLSEATYTAALLAGAGAYGGRFAASFVVLFVALAMICLWPTPTAVVCAAAVVLTPIVIKATSRVIAP